MNQQGYVPKKKKERAAGNDRRELSKWRMSALLWQRRNPKKNENTYQATQIFWETSPRLTFTYFFLIVCFKVLFHLIFT